MMSSVSSLSLCWTLSLCLLVSVSAVPVNITVEPGEDVSLPCRAPSNTDVLEWTRPELEPGYVLMIRDGRPDPYNQLPSFKDRVELKDREMKDGDVSIILKNVTTEDAGRYECRVDQGKTIIVQEYISTDPISIINLEVHQSGGTGGLGDKGLQIGLGVGLPLFVVIVGGI